MNCHNFQTEIEEIESAKSLRQELQAHLAGCQNCGIFYAEQTKLRQMIGNLERVSAPHDFDVQLRKRLAYGNQASTTSMRWKSFAYAVPTAAFAILIGIWFLIPNLPTKEVPVAKVDAPKIVETIAKAEVQTPIPYPIIIDTDTKIAKGDVSNKLPKDKILPKVISIITGKPKNKVENNRILPSRNIETREESIIRDSAVKSVTVPRMPNGFPPKPKNLSDETPNVTANLLSVNDTFTQLGIEAETNSEKVWRVKNVKANSVGETSGVKANDIIEAIDDQPISAETKVKSFNGKTLNVVRNGQKIEIKIQNKP